MNLTDFTNYDVVVIPFSLKFPKDGGKVKKRPLVDNWGKWRNSSQTREEVDNLNWGNADGVALLTGGVGEIYCFDIDAQDEGERKDILDEITGYLDSLEANYYCESTPSGGYHVLVRCKTTLPNIKLIAEKLETRGDGGLVVVAPSIGYNQIGSIDIETFLDSDERMEEEDLQALINLLKEVKESPNPDYNSLELQNSLSIREVEILELLKNNGWKVAYERNGSFGTTYYLTRPNKDTGVSATYNHKGSKCLYLFSSSVEGLKLGYNNAIDILTKYRFNGDRAAANQYAIGSLEAPLETDGLSDVFEANEKSGKFTVSKTGLSRWFSKQGFFAVKPFGNDYVKNVKIEGNFVISITGETLLKALIEAARRSGVVQYEEAAYNFTMTRSASSILLLLENVEIEFLKDDRKTCYLPFRNACVVIRSYEITLVNYEELGFAVWQDSVINHDIELVDSSGKTANFLKNICTNAAGGIKQLDTNLYKLVRETAGYLIHSYKDEGHAKAVVLMEDVIAGRYESQGGRGKSLFLKLISSLAPSTMLDARSGSVTGSFAFSTHKEGKKMFVVQDITPTFNTELLFAKITDDWVVNRKYEQEFIIPFEYSPKIAITSNYSIVGGDSSNARRFIEVSLKSYYTENFSPIDDNDVGRLLSSDWEKAEWDRHYCELFNCVKEFLYSGYVSQYISETAMVRKIHSRIPEKFIDAVEAVFEEMIEGEFYDTNTLFSLCRRQDESFNSSGRSLVKWLKEYSNLSQTHTVVDTKKAVDKTDVRKNGLKKVKK